MELSEVLNHGLARNLSDADLIALRPTSRAVKYVVDSELLTRYPYLSITEIIKTSYTYKVIIKLDGYHLEEEDDWEMSYWEIQGVLYYFWLNYNYNDDELVFKNRDTGNRISINFNIDRRPLSTLLLQGEDYEQPITPDNITVDHVKSIFEDQIINNRWFVIIDLDFGRSTKGQEIFLFLTGYTEKQVNEYISGYTFAVEEGMATEGEGMAYARSNYYKINRNGTDISLKPRAIY